MIKRLIRTAIVTIVLAVVLIGAWAWWQRGQPPKWYNPPSPSDPVVQAQAEDVEMAVAQMITKVREPEERWGMRLTEDHVNTWLATRLHDWVDNQVDLDWPAKLQMVQMQLQPDEITVAVAFGETLDDAQVVAFAVTPDARDGEMFTTLVSASIGRIEFSGGSLDAMIKRLEKLNTSWDIMQILPFAQGERAIPIALDLSDDRRVTIEEVRCKEGVMDLICRTSFPGAPTRVDDTMRDSHPAVSETSVNGPE
ncbi:MAG: hypothetical protein AAF432_02645 [Planctomycetota bacterium]